MDQPHDPLAEEVRHQEAYLRMKQAILDTELAAAHLLMEQDAALDARLSAFRERVMDGEITDERQLEEYLREADAQRHRQSEMRAVLRRVIAARHERDAAQRESERKRREYTAATGAAPEQGGPPH
jgi:hypothetical protein